MSQFQVKNIAVIGAGPAGLASVKYLRHQDHAFERIVVYERQAEVGGVWNYSPFPPSQPEKLPEKSPTRAPDPPVYASCAANNHHDHLLNKSGSNGVVAKRAAPCPHIEGETPLFPSPMYDNLNTNIPHTLMRFSDLAFPEGSVIFPPREDVQSYLVAYSQPVRDLIRFCTEVLDVRLVRTDRANIDDREEEEKRDKWEVHVRNTVTGALTTEVFDAVVVASGHYELSYVPDVPGLAEFQKRYPGVVSLSKAYRNATAFTNKRTLVVGNAASGLDIARQITATCAQPLLISAQSRTPPEMLEHCGGEEVPEVEAFISSEDPGTPPRVRFKGGRTEEVDAVIYCTGYLFSFPFIQVDSDMLGDPPLIGSGRRVQGLFRHLFHIRHPTLVFPGLLIKAVPFPISEGQAAVFARVWSNSLPLPAMSEMMEWETQELKERGEAIHVLPDEKDIDYINGMHEWAMKGTEGGKEPPVWEGELAWQRHTYKQAKLAFEKQGRIARSLVELGFEYHPIQVPLV